MIKSQADFLRVAFKAYDNPKISSVSEFEADIKRFSYMNIMISRYREDNDLTKLRLTINHIVILLNTFGIDSGVDLIKFKTNEENLIYIETILYFLRVITTAKELDFKLLNILINL